MAALLGALERLGYESRVGPLGDYWFRGPGEKERGPYFIPSPYLGWLSAPEWKRIVEMIGADVIDVYRALQP